jgi:hypothetical protein
LDEVVADDEAYNSLEIVVLLKVIF